jgi:molybdenum cofactor cytidylyltransferase
MPEPTPTHGPQGDCALLILAAGESRRMGQPKQLLPLHGRPLIEHMVRAALASPVWPVVVVTGANGEAVRRAVAHHPVRFASNPDWRSGPGSSLRSGLRLLEGCSPAVRAAMVVLADQPAFDPAAACRLLDQWRRSGRSCAAVRWGERLGPPAVFARSTWRDLLASDSAHGARDYLAAHRAEVHACDLPRMTIDLDTPADYAAWLKSVSGPAPP